MFCVCGVLNLLFALYCGCGCLGWLVVWCLGWLSWLIVAVLWLVLWLADLEYFLWGWYNIQVWVVGVVLLWVVVW